jgi:hypothetical protein
MRKIFFFTAAVILLSASTRAELIDRGNGLVYDVDLNITWLQDANYSGLTFTWDEANLWAENLVFQGFNDWRLPVSDSCSGNGCSGSEMGHLFYTEGITSDSGGLFSNIRPSIYWSSTENDSDSSQAWRFNFKYGTQDVSDKTTTRYAWAVRDGDAAPPVAPEPISSLLFVSGGTVLVARKYLGKLKVV